MSYKEYLENNFEESKEFEIKKLKEEVKRLREALKDALQYCPQYVVKRIKEPKS